MATRKKNLPSLFTKDEKMKLGPGYSPHDTERIRSLTAQLVTGRVASGSLNPEDTQALKAAVAECARDAKAAYDAALEFLSG